MQQKNTTTINKTITTEQLINVHVHREITQTATEYGMRLQSIFTGTLFLKYVHGSHEARGFSPYSITATYWNDKRQNGEGGVERGGEGVV